MKEKYNGVEVPRDGAAIEYHAAASREKPHPLHKTQRMGHPKRPRLRDFWQ
jgi:hypothetical protein